MARDLEEILKDEGDLPSEPTFGPEIPLHEAMRRTEQTIQNLERLEREATELLGEDLLTFLANCRRH